MMEDRNRLSTRDLANAAADRRDRAERRERLDDRHERAEAHDMAALPATDIRPHPADAPPPPGAPVDTRPDRDTLFHDEEAAAFRSRWEAIQTGFVDEPRKAVEEADALVAQAVARLAEVFSEERATLERQWDRGDNISTEDLRIALRRYRAFFDRLLSV